MKLHIQSLLRAVSMGALIASGVACSGNQAPAPSDLSDIEIAPINGRIANGTVLNLKATGIYRDGHKQDVTADVSWSSSAPNVAAVGNTRETKGLAAGVAVGQTTISATLAGVAGSTVMSVADASLNHIELAVPTSPFAVGAAVPIQAIGIFSDNSRQDLTDQATWTSSNNAVVHIGDSAGSKGVASALAGGTAIITAHFGGAIASTRLTVASATLTRIEVASATDRVIVGTTIALSATGIYSDNSRHSLTRQATWTSADPNLLDIAQVGNDVALAHVLSTGSVTVNVSFGGQTGSIALTLSSARLQHLEVSSVARGFKVGDQIPFTATGVYEDDSRQNLTDQVTWSSSNSAVIAISNATGYNGEAVALSAGTAEIRASFNDTTGSTAVSVNTAILNSISVSAAATTVAVGAQLALIARGNYSDGTVRDITDQVTWRSFDTTIATVSNASSSPGLLTPVAASATPVTIAAFLNQVTGTFTVNVRAPQLTLIRIEPANSRIATGTFLALRAIGVYDNASEHDLTDQVIWDADTPSIASVSNSRGAEGRVHGLQAGNITVTATVSGVTAGSTMLTVTPAPLASIEITPTGSNITVGTTVAFTATGIFADNSRQDITSDVVWRVSDDTIIQVYNAATNTGAVTALAAGTTTLTASFDGISASIDVTAINTPTTPVSLTLNAEPNVIFNDGNDATTLDVVVRAAGGDAYVVPDGTLVNLTLVSGSGALIDANLVTVNGRVTTTMTSNTIGTITLEANVDGSAVGNQISVYVTNRFADVFWQEALFDGGIINNVVQPGARFGYFILNTSNRAFSLNYFRLINGGAELGYQTLNGQQLLGGQGIGHMETLSNSETDAGITALYELAPISGNTFLLSFNYPLPANSP